MSKEDRMQEEVIKHDLRDTGSINTNREGIIMDEQSVNNHTEGNTNIGNISEVTDSLGSTSSQTSGNTRDVQTKPVNQVNRYCMMVISKYFNEYKDYVEIEKACKEYRGITEQYHYNPISFHNDDTKIGKKEREMFRNAETLYIYGGDIDYIDKEFKKRFEDMIAFTEDGKSIKKIIVIGDVSLRDMIKYEDDYRIEFKNITSPFKQALDPRVNKIGMFENEYVDNDIRDIAIPEQIIEIGDDAFNTKEIYNIAKKVKSIIIPVSVTRIGTRAFKDSLLTNIVIPDSVSELGESCFESCTDLTSVRLPGRITKLPNKCFYECENIQSIIIPQGVKEIGSDCFGECEKLTGIDIPSSVSILEDNCFYKCNKLGKVNIPSTITEIGLGCFEYCWSLSTIEMAELTKLREINSYMFYRCTELSEIVLPTTITRLSDHCFHACEKISTINIPDSVRFIGKFCFSGCRGLVKIDLPTGIKEIPKYCFEGCINLTSVNIPVGVERMDEKCFFFCYKLTEINIPSSVTSLGYSDIFSGTFANCLALARINDNQIIENITVLPSEVFSNCSNLSNIILSTSITRLEHGCFEECTSLREIAMSSKVSRFEYECFKNCNKLESMRLIDKDDNKVGINLPCVTYIGDGVFSHCTSIKDIWISSKILETGVKCFEECRQLTNIDFNMINGNKDTFENNDMQYDYEIFLHKQQVREEYLRQKKQGEL